MCTTTERAGVLQFFCPHLSRYPADLAPDTSVITKVWANTLGSACTVLWGILTILRVVGLALLGILHTTFYITQFQTVGMSLSLKFTNASVKRIHFAFLLQEFRFRFRKHMISVTLMDRFH